MEIDDDLLAEKFEASSKQKDAIYERRHEKLNDIMNEIRTYEQQIKDYQNAVDNILRPQSQAIVQTYEENKGKYEKLQQMLQAMDER